MTIERIEQPDMESCFRTCVAMLTGIDVDLLPDATYAPTIAYFPDEDLVALEFGDNFFRWQKLLDSLGYEVLVSEETPRNSTMPYIASLLIYEGQGLAHSVVVDTDGTIIDPAPNMMFNGLTIYDHWCNVVPAKWGYIAIRERSNA